jgi:hypothetical protein
MPHLVEANLLNKILNFFGGNSSSNTKNDFLNKLKKSDPKLAQAFNAWESEFIKLLKASRAVKVKHKMDTTEIDKLIQKYS